ncbi:hypothetical protein LU631_11455 [Erwinia tracheiphila]|uniref:Uncharacterized protein n=1 Tax=Erwinia tracheiphila TaxID=65700 RepID=A0A0M2KE07_9GAMM|nr:hypothetical protein [Erwinia tracheiphila]EOS93714.1 hypothetical protein ETR_17674 [Erwinia tracheiphila PSU-1]KKF35537.1 hypothetical protein SY86_09015 [Erwinia tracheiphila]UIA89711.1 hypothetical protein LU631_11455 [Erwinia tracheiphila]UIA98011.1 hypothetical protein LU633_09665 [Erwinia tracheiphila]
MKETITREELKNYGFTDNQINILQEYSDKDDKPFITLLEELKKRFYAGVLLVSLMTIALLVSVLNYDNGHLIGFVIVSIILYTSVIFLIPMQFGYKAMKYLKIKKNSL